MCNCNKTPNMISVITKALQRKFPEHDIIVEELISQDINDFNQQRFLDENTPASWFFGNLYCDFNGDINIPYLVLDNFQIGIFGEKTENLFFNRIQPKTSDGDNVSKLDLIFYGWQIYLKDSKLVIQTPVINHYEADLAEDGCVPGRDVVDENNPVEVWEFDGSFFLDEELTMPISETAFPAVLRYRAFESEDEWTVPLYDCR